MGTIQIDGLTPKLTIGNATAEDTAIIYDGNAKDFYIALDDSADKLVIGEGSTVGTNNILTITDDTVTLGDGAATDTKIVFDGNAQDFYIGLDDSADDLIIGLGSTVGTTPAISINEDRDVTISDGAIDFDIASHDTSNGLKLGGTLVTATAAELNIMDGVTSTAAEINLIDGGTSRGTTAVASGDGILINDGGTMRMTNVDTVSTYFASHSVGGSSIVTVGTIGTGTWQGTAIASGYIAADAITGAKIADDAIDSEHYTDGSIDNAHIADNAIDSEHYADGSIDNAHIADDAIDSEHYADGSIDNAHIADDQIDSEHYVDGSIDTAHLAADAVTGAKIADDAIDSEHYTDGSIDNAHIADNAIDSEHYADGSIDNAHIADDQIDSEHYVDGSIDTAHLSADCITAAKIADDVINSEHYAAGSIDNEHIADDAIDSEHYAAGSIDTAHLADDQITLAKMAGLARGKLIYGDSSGNPAALAVGSADQVLTHDGTDFAWADSGGGGKVLQVVSGTNDTETDTQGTSFVTSNTSVNITPAASSSKILILYSMTCRYHNSGSSGPETAKTTVYRDSTNLNSNGYSTLGYITNSNQQVVNTTNSSILDSPSTTSQITYSIRGKTGAGSNHTTLHMNYSARSTITAIEIGA